MGLDMYLERIDRKALPYKDIDPDDADPDTYAKMVPYLKDRGEFISWKSLFEEVGYWRKANAIHNWFVVNAQGGVDDCGRYEVSQEQLKKLAELCEEVITQSVSMMGMVVNGYTMNAEGTHANLEPGKVVMNPEVAKELLPTTEGFFFGGTNYDQYYISDINETLEIVNQVLATTDFSTHAIFYSSSW